MLVELEYMSRETGEWKRKTEGVVDKGTSHSSTLQTSESLGLGEEGRKIEQELKQVSAIITALKNTGYQAYIVGGSVRDLLMNRVPHDWDITTDAKPERVREIFDHTYTQNTRFGTVGVVCDDASKFTVEVTTYSNQTHPDEVEFCSSLEEDLSRRDFTINAMAVDPTTSYIVDYQNGRKHIEQRLIKTVGSPYERFSEDTLRILRAVRFSAELNFEIDEEDLKVIKKFAPKIKEVAKERVSAELSKILMSKNPMDGIKLLQETKILKEIIPELEKGIGCEQNWAHKYDVFEHNLRTLQHSADTDCPLHIRLSALLHDVAKPHTRVFSDEKKDWTFYKHEIVGAEIAEKILRDLKYPNEIVDKVRLLVRWHMFFSDAHGANLSAVRKLVAKVGEKNIWDLMKLRRCDRIGAGKEEEVSDNLRKFMSMIDESLRDPISVKMLKVNGDDLMKLKGERGGPYVGYILQILLDEVLEDPKKNDKESMLKRAKELLELPEKELESRGRESRSRITEEEKRELEEIRGKRGVS